MGMSQFKGIFGEEVVFGGHMGLTHAIDIRCELYLISGNVISMV